MYGRPAALGTSSVAAQATCPPCSYLWDGRCLVCENGAAHPGCQGCVDGRLPPTPWYKHDILLGIASGVAVSIVVAVAAPRLNDWLSKKR